MAFEVRISEPAILEIEEASAFIAKDSVESAKKWNRGLWELIESLSEMPRRFGVIPESEELGLEYRSAPHYSHRVIYRIDELGNQVHIVRVYHGSRRPLNPGDL